MDKREFYNLVSMWSMEKRRNTSLHFLLKDATEEDRIISLSEQCSNSDAKLELLEEGIHSEVDYVERRLREIENEKAKEEAKD